MKPSADDLLAFRLRNGWTPTTTLLQTGPAILGHAACLTTLEKTANNCLEEPTGTAKVSLAQE
jgi:hypothetical protein